MFGIAQLVFETKKIQLETLGEYLKAVRQTFNLSVHKASQQAGVNAKWLEALEENILSSLPADVYVYGTLKQLAIFYKISEEELLNQYKKEREISKQIAKKEKLTIGKLTSFWRGLVITPKVVIIFSTGIFIFFTLAYLVWQVLSINRAPTLELIEPKDQAIIESLSANIKGTTNAGMTVSVNGQEIFVGTGGEFNTTLSLVPGPQDINVVSKNRFGKETVRSIRVFVQPESSQKNAEIGLVLILNVTASTSISYISDNGLIERKDFTEAGAEYKIIAKDKIVLSASNGGALKAILNGEDLKVLGKLGEPLMNITFESSGFKEALVK